MAQVGFIRNKNEIKYLILYIAERLIAPVPFEVMQELTMCDPAIEFFDFSECLNYLVRTEHLTCSGDELYAITEKGLQNGRATADEIPYSVRLNADGLVDAQNQKIKRARQVQSKITPRGNGTQGVELRFNDDYGIPLWQMELAVPDEAQAKLLVKRFQNAPEQMYNDLIKLLFSKP
ncbi:MAG: DUF4364 family protein [Oscillospiraceae bacterium]|nr:DUF4364 family protein [Oscillospiraceae bacterium]